MVRCVATRTRRQQSNLWRGGPLCELQPAVAQAVLVRVRLETLLLRAPRESVARQWFVILCMLIKTPVRELSHSDGRCGAVLRCTSWRLMRTALTKLLVRVPSRLDS